MFFVNGIRQTFKMQSVDWWRSPHKVAAPERCHLIGELQKLSASGELGR
jgi:hypothetical protein